MWVLMRLICATVCASVAGCQLQLEEPYDTGLEPTNTRAFAVCGGETYVVAVGTGAGWEDGFIAVHRLSSGELVWHREWPASIGTLAVSPGGDRVIVGDFVGTVTLFACAPDGKLLQQAQGNIGGQVESICWTKENAVVVGRRDGTLLLVDPAALQYQHRLGQHGGRPRDVRASPNGTLVASSARDGRLIIWQCASRRTVFEFSTEDAYPVHIRWGPDGRWLAVSYCGAGKIGASEERTAVRVWDTGNWREVWTYCKKDQYMVGIAFASNSVLTVGDPCNREHRRWVNVDLSLAKATDLAWDSDSLDIEYLDGGKKLLGRYGAHKLSLWNVCQGKLEEVWRVGYE